jgi:predicted site-specific integrase-resolvase
VKPLHEIPLKSLLRLSPLQPGESLPSLVARLTLLNHYASPAILQRISLAQWPDRPDCPSRAATFRRLEALTRIPAFELYAASDHAIVSTQPPSSWLAWQPLDPEKGIPFWDHTPVRGSVRPTQASHFCPNCLSEAAHHRLAWRPVTMSVCLIHDCLLAQACPQCQSPVSIRDIVLLRCACCRADLRQATTSSIQTEAWGRTAQETLWAWLTGRSAPDPDLGWPKHDPPVLCSLAEGLAMGMLSFPERFPYHPLAPTIPLKVHHGRNTLSRHPTSQIYWAYTAALKWMVYWPEGFREFLQHCAPRPGASLDSALGFFYSYWVRQQWNHDQFRFIREALDSFGTDRACFLASQAQPNIPFERAFAYARLEEAAQILGTAESMVHRLGQMGLIHPCRFDSSRSCETFFLRGDLLAVKRGWNETLSLQEAAGWLGVAPQIVLDLSREQLLKAERNSDQSEERIVFFTRYAVARLLERVNSRTAALDLQKGLITLAEAAQQLACVHLNEARLLTRILSRNLRAWRGPSQQDDWGVGAISFTQKDIDALLNEIALSKGWLSADEVSADWGVDEAVFLNWIERGLIKPVIIYNGQPYLKPREIQNFSAQFIFDREAKDLLGISWPRLLGYIRRGKLTPLAGPGLDGCVRYLLPRKKVERLAKRLEKRSRQADFGVQPAPISD